MRSEGVPSIDIGCLFEEPDRPSSPSVVEEYEEESYIDSETEGEEHDENDSDVESDFELEVKAKDESSVTKNHSNNHRDNIKKKPTAIEIQKNLYDFIRNNNTTPSINMLPVCHPLLQLNQRLSFTNTFVGIQDSRFKPVIN